MDIPASHTASGIPWALRPQDGRAVLAMAQQHGIPELLAQVLAGRGVALDDVPDFLAPTLRAALPDPFHLRDMDKAAARIVRALKAGERIAIFGDYDVDGATSTALLWHYLTPLGGKLRPYIPDRMTEGYGPSIAAFDTLIGEGAQLIITVDCGAMAFDPIAHANTRGVDVVVLDHHQGAADMPAAHALVNPNRADETSPHRNLAAVGVTFLALVAINKLLREEGFFSSPSKGEGGRGTPSAHETGFVPASPHPNPPLQGEGAFTEPSLLALLDLVALGTVCDVMSLTGLNRAFVSQGLKQLATRRQPGLACLGDVAGLNERPGTYHLGFVYGPRINAGGRVGKSDLGVQLLTQQAPERLQQIASTLDQHNRERQAIEQGVLEQAMEQAARQTNAPVILVAGQGWHPGVIGIVAGRLKEKFARPAIAIALDGDQGKGSARSVTGADMGAAIHAAVTTGIASSGGGHAMAAGFSLPADRVPELHAFLCTRLEASVAHYQESRARLLDGWLSCSAATPELIEELDRAAPYGIGHPGPRFALLNARILHRKPLKEKHLRLVLGDELGGRLEAVAFNVLGTPLGSWLMSEPTLHLAGELSMNRWQGRETPQFLVEDAAKP